MYFLQNARLEGNLRQGKEAVVANRKSSICLGCQESSQLSQEESQAPLDTRQGVEQTCPRQRLGFWSPFGQMAGNPGMCAVSSEDSSKETAVLETKRGQQWGSENRNNHTKLVLLFFKEQTHFYPSEVWKENNRKLVGPRSRY